MKKLLIIISALTITTASLAADGPSWNFIGASYLDADIDGLDELSPTGYGLEGSFLASENIIIYAGYSSISDEIMGIDTEVNSTNIGIGYRFEVSDNADFAIGAGYAGAEACIDGYECFDDSGYSLLANYKVMLSDKLELSLMADYVGISDESETGFGIEVAYFFTNEFSLGLGFSTADDVDMLGVTVAIHF